MPPFLFEVVPIVPPRNPSSFAEICPFTWISFADSNTNPCIESDDALHATEETFTSSLTIILLYLFGATMKV